VCDLVRGLGSLKFVPGPGYLCLAALHPGLRPSQIIGHLGDFEHREQLPLRHAVSDVHVDVLDVAGHLRHHIDFLKRPELGGQDQVAGQVFGRDFGHGDGGRVRGVRDCLHVSGPGTRSGEQGRRDEKNRARAKRPSETKSMHSRLQSSGRHSAGTTTLD